MHSLGLMLLAWLLGYLFIDWRRIRQLIPAILAGMLVVGIPPAMPGVDPLYLYQNTSSPWTYLLLVQMGIAPLMSAWFAQGLTGKGAPDSVRVFRFGVGFWAVEQLAGITGLIRYTSRWGPLQSLVIKALFLSLVALVHYYSGACASPHQRGDRSVREVTTTGVLRSSGRADMAAGPMDR